MHTLVFCRHARPDTQFSGPGDSTPLSDEGKAIQRFFVQQLIKEGIAPTHIFCSPLLRAVQSAKIIADHWNLPIQEMPALGTSFDGEIILEKAKEAPQNSCLFFVGHAGAMEELIEELVGVCCLPAGLAKSSGAILSFPEQVDKGLVSNFVLLNPGQSYPGGSSL